MINDLEKRNTDWRCHFDLFQSQQSRFLTFENCFRVNEKFRRGLFENCWEPTGWVLLVLAISTRVVVCICNPDEQRALSPEGRCVAYPVSSYRDHVIWEKQFESENKPISNTSKYTERITMILVLYITKTWFQHKPPIFFSFVTWYSLIFLIFLAVFTNILARKLENHLWYSWKAKKKLTPEGPRSFD